MTSENKTLSLIGEAPVRSGFLSIPQLGRRLLAFVRSKPLGAIGAFIIIVLILSAILAPWISPYSPDAQSVRWRLTPPGGRFLIGADNLGRDILSRVIWGSRISLWVGIIAVGLGTLSGSLLGLISGYWGGKTDIIIQRVMDVLMSFPALILAIAVMAVLGTSITNVMIAIAVVMVPGASRIVRGTVLSAKENLYVEAARVVGCRDGRILLMHVLPNVAAPIIVIATIGLGNAILAEASLSFLGLGTPPPTPSWGGMLSGASRQFLERAPWIAISPGLAITLAVLAFNLLGDALRDVLDPRLRGSR